MQDLSSPTRDRTLTLCIGSAESQPLDHQGSVWIFFFLAVLCLRCCTWAFSSCGKQRLLFMAVCELLIVVASLVEEHRL